MEAFHFLALFLGSSGIHFEFNLLYNDIAALLNL